MFLALTVTLSLLATEGRPPVLLGITPGSGGDAYSSSGGWPWIGGGMYFAEAGITGGLIGAWAGWSVGDQFHAGATGMLVGGIGVGVLSGLGFGALGFWLGRVAELRPQLRNAIMAGGMIGGLIAGTTLIIFLALPTIYAAVRPRESAFLYTCFVAHGPNGCF